MTEERRKIIIDPFPSAVLVPFVIVSGPPPFSSFSGASHLISQSYS
jgi:hypothetical protein